MPHFGQASGVADQTPGHIGQIYRAEAGSGFGVVGGAGSVCPQQQLGFLTGLL